MRRLIGILLVAAAIVGLCLIYPMVAELFQAFPATPFFFGGYT